jgi:hypothetical protein
VGVDGSPLPPGRPPLPPPPPPAPPSAPPVETSRFAPLLAPPPTPPPFLRPWAASRWRRCTAGGAVPKQCLQLVRSPQLSGLLHCPHCHSGYRGAPWMRRDIDDEACFLPVPPLVIGVGLRCAEWCDWRSVRAAATRTSVRACARWRRCRRCHDGSPHRCAVLAARQRGSWHSAGWWAPECRANGLALSESAPVATSDQCRHPKPKARQRTIRKVTQQAIRHKRELGALTENGHQSTPFEPYDDDDDDECAFSGRSRFLGSRQPPGPPPRLDEALRR